MVVSPVVLRQLPHQHWVQSSITRSNAQRCPTTGDLANLSENDLSYFGGELHTSFVNPLSIHGDTGISAGIAPEFNAIKGQPRAIPLFIDAPTGNGNNANYTIVKFVGIRIMHVKLTGMPSRSSFSRRHMSIPT